MCRNSDTVANRKKKRVALMGLEKGWDQEGKGRGIRFIKDHINTTLRRGLIRR